MMPNLNLTCPKTPPKMTNKHRFWTCFCMNGKGTSSAQDVPIFDMHIPQLLG